MKKEALLMCVTAGLLITQSFTAVYMFCLNGQVQNLRVQIAEQEVKPSTLVTEVVQPLWRKFQPAVESVQLQDERMVGLTKRVVRIADILDKEVKQRVDNLAVHDKVLAEFNRRIYNAEDAIEKSNRNR